MRSIHTHGRKFIAQKALFVTAASAVGLFCSTVRAGGVPNFFDGEGGVFSHYSGSPVQSGNAYIVELPIYPTPPALLKHTITFSPNAGNSNASAGLENTQSSTQTRIIISSGTGVSQTDPSSSETASSLNVYFTAYWSAPAGGFGAPIAGNFSLPIGANVGVNGTASVSASVSWSYSPDGEDFYSLGSYSGSDTFNNVGGTKALKEVTSLTAPTTLFTPNSIDEYDTIEVAGNITFTADADDPALIEIPTADDFSDLGVTTDQFGSLSLDVVPEPSSPVLLAVGASAYLLGRRRKNRLV
jgi:hypothetical protein